MDLPLRLLALLPHPLEAARTAVHIARGARHAGRTLVHGLADGLRASPASQALRWQPDAQVCGAQVGEVGDGAAMLWVRTPWPARVYVQWDTRPLPEPGQTLRAGVRCLDTFTATEATDLTARTWLRELPPDYTIHARITALELGGTRVWRTGVCFRAAPRERSHIKFAWSADVGGQGFGIPREQGRLPVFDLLRGRGLDFFLHLGDAVYADHPVPSVAHDAAGRPWRNLTTRGRSAVAQTLADFRACWRYNWLDPAFAEFTARVPLLAMWDDHEVVNNWSPALDLAADARYQQAEVSILAAQASRAFREYAPVPLAGFGPDGRLYRRVGYGPLLDVFLLDMHSHRGPNSGNLQDAEGLDTALLGEPQLQWLQEALRASTATWKVIGTGMPLGVCVPDGRDAAGQPRWQGAANGDAGLPRGRELEIARLLSFIRAHDVRNVVWLCADVHYAAAHEYRPEQAAYRDFLPFWEFVAGPLHAGTGVPLPLDGTFGPQLHFAQGAPVAGLAPDPRHQYFGEVEIDPDDACMTVHLCNATGQALHTVRLVPG